MKNYPKEHVPTDLREDVKPKRKSRKVRFIVASSKKTLLYGPFIELRDALEMVPEFDNVFIYKTDGEKWQKLYAWDNATKWVLLD